MPIHKLGDIMISVHDTNKLIYLGIQGEAEARKVFFNFEDWVLEYGNGTVELVNQRNGEKTAYQVALTILDKVAVWMVSDTDNARAGAGRCQLRYKVNDVVVKTAIFKTMVDEALGNVDEPGNPYKDIIDELEDLVEEAQEAASEILDLTVDAEDGEEADVEKQVDPETGEINLHFTLPKGQDGSDGADGVDGHSPVITGSKSGTTTTLYSDGVSIATINDGADGEDGEDGHSPIITASKSGKTTTIYVDGTGVAIIKDGTDGQDGDDYVLTNQDKSDIAAIVIQTLPTWTGGSY